MKLRTILLAAATAGLVVVIAAGIWLASSLDSLLKSAIETYGPEITGVSVKVGAVSLSPRSGHGSVRNLRLGNPKGYKADRALALGEISITLDPASLARDVILIREVVVSGADITYEKSGNIANLDVIQRNVEAYTRKFGGGKPAAGGPQTKMIIDHLYIRNSKASVASALTAGRPVATTLPNIHLRDIGKRTNGATAGQVTQQVMGALTASATRAAASALRGVGKSAGGAVDSVRGLFR